MNLFGVHDREGYAFPPPGGWVVDTVALSEAPLPTDYTAFRGDINWLVRLNWGYGSTGTIPMPHEVDRFVERVQSYALRSRGAYAFIIGNEPNHEGERPNGTFITPTHYAGCYNACFHAIKSGSTQIRVMPAAFAPYHANPYPWTDYARDVYKQINQADGINIHAYTRGMAPESIQSQDKMGEPLAGTYSGFLTYLDALSLVPSRFKHLPAYITEFNPIPDWENRNTGVVQAAYKEIEGYNAGNGTQKIHCLALFRWKTYEDQVNGQKVKQRWGIDEKPEVQKDFLEAVHNAPQKPQEGPESTFLPQVGQSITYAPSAPPSPSTAFSRDFDERARKRGVQIVDITPKKGEYAWRAVKVKWLDEAESQGRHHFYFDTLDEAGNRVAGVPILVSWPDGNTVIISEAKPGEPYSANFPMSASRNEFSAIVTSGDLSEMVRGVGMGAETGSGFNAGVHTSTFVVFQKVKQNGASPKEEKVAASPRNLAHPVQDGAYRRITQKWMENGHTGLDFAAPLGARIVAVDSGKVLENDWDAAGYGHYIKLQHEWGESLYAHLSQKLVARHNLVEKGQLIGLSGSTGNSTGPHLHFALRIFPYNRADGKNGFSDPTPHLYPQIAPELREKLKLMEAFTYVSKETGVEWQLLAALAYAESGFNPSAISSAGAMGFVQIMPATWTDWSLRFGRDMNPYSMMDNLLVGATYLKWLLGHYQGNRVKALTAYNFGPGNVDAGRNAPPETILYVQKIIFAYEMLKGLGL
jgi:murein DD-endopeptidase MepM/ murein hydrolase activator NlpD